MSTVADSESPADAARALPLAQFGRAFFRAEIRRLSGDLTFCNGQIRQLTSELEGLVAETTLRGRTIENLRAELRTLNDAQTRALRVIEELEQRITQDRKVAIASETKLNQDVAAHTLAAAHRYERALRSYQAPIRGWALRRAEQQQSIGPESYPGASDRSIRGGGLKPEVPVLGDLWRRWPQPNVMALCRSWYVWHNDGDPSTKQRALFELCEQIRSQGLALEAPGGEAISGSAWSQSPTARLQHPICAGTESGRHSGRARLKSCGVRHSRRS